MANRKDIVAAWEKYAGRKEFKVVDLKDVNGLKTVGVVNTVTGSLVAEALPENEADLAKCGEPLSVTHRNEEVEPVEVDNKSHLADAKAEKKAEAERKAAEEKAAADKKAKEDAAKNGGGQGQ